MKQVTQDLRTGHVRVVEAPKPGLQPHGVLVRTSHSIISAGTERSKVELGQSSMLGKARKRPDDVAKVLAKVRRDGLLNTYKMVKERLAEASPLGYSAAGVIESVGELTEGLAPGDRVACAGGGYANHAEYLYVPANLTVRIPDGVSFEDAAYTTLGAIALQGFRQSAVVLGERVAVIGLGLIGLLTIQIAHAAGCQAIGFDVDESKVDLARACGAVVVGVLGKDDPETMTAAFTDGLGVDTVIITASTAGNEPLELAGHLARDRASVVVVGDVGLSFSRGPYYTKELSLRMSRSYGPGRYDPSFEEFGQAYPEGYVYWTERRNMEEFLRLLATEQVDLSKITTHRFPVDRAPEAYEMVTGKTDERFIGVVLEYPERPDETAPVVVKAAGESVARDKVGIGLIGAGNFVTATLLPALRSQDEVSLVAVNTASGLSAQDMVERHNFGYAAESPEQVFADAQIDAVLIGTRHDTHADLVVKALQAGKTVFVEKPLAVTRPELDAVVEAWQASTAEVLVGFNRRFAPVTQAVKERLARLGAPPVIQCRINAGTIPSDHWTQTLEQGGGRIVGEMCHFVDLASYLAGASPVKVHALALRNGKSPALQDSLVATFTYSNGAVASVMYVAEGDTAYPKEAIEVFCGGQVMVIDDFRAASFTSQGKTTREKGGHIDKGHKREMQEFLALAKGTPSSILTFPDAAMSTAATLCVIESLTTGQAVDIPPLSAARG